MTDITAASWAGRLLFVEMRIGGRFMDFNRVSQGPQIVGRSGVLDGLGHAEQLLSAFFSASNIGLAIIDTQLNFLAVNVALADMNGVSVEAHLGKSIRDVLGDAATQIETILHSVLLTGKAVMNVALTLQLRTRAEVGHWIVHYFPMNNDAGRVARIGVVVVEVTEQKKLEERLCGLADDLKHEKERLQMFLEISDTLNSTPALKKMVPSISASIKKAMNYDWVDVSILQESSKSIRLYVTDSSYIDPDVSIPLSASICREVIAEGLPRVLDRTNLVAIHSTAVDRMLKIGIQSACCVPLITPKGVIGSFNVASVKKECFRTEDIDLLTQIAMRITNTLDSASRCDQIVPSVESAEIGYVSTQPKLHREVHFEEIVGESQALRNVLDQAKTVAPSDATVLILGDTGTGKELIARAIHYMSSRKDAAFVKVNCAAIPGGLLESELFGHEKGAFTGAFARKIGRLEAADRGTVLLDEIGDIPLELQAKLLRVLQDQEFERLGSNRTVRVNVRLLAATNQDLGKRVGEQAFRRDLFYRLNVFPIRMPSLRERPEDIALLARYFTEKYARRTNRTIETIPTEAMSALLMWDWPGNIRELENFIHRAVILTQGNVLNVPVDELLHPAPQRSSTVDRIDRDQLLRVLRQTRGLTDGPRGAAAKLCMSPATLRSVMKKMNILPKHYQN